MAEMAFRNTRGWATQANRRRTKDLIGTILYRSGAFAAYHALANRSTLTVVMFHRVLSRIDDRWPGALAEWTIAAPIFDQCLTFFVRHYNVVSLPDVLAATKSQHKLPPRSLLISFDDGYADNLQYALPLLRRHNLPAVVFVSSDMIGQRDRLWTEKLLGGFLAGQITADQIEILQSALVRRGFAAVCGDGPPEMAVRKIAQAAPQMPAELAEEVLFEAGLLLPKAKQREMLTWSEANELANANVAIGAHGKTHVALPFAQDLQAELDQPRRAIRNAVGAACGCADTLSFPHGLFTPAIVAEASARGYKLLFSTVETITRLHHGSLPARLLGRINIDAMHVAPDDQLDASRLARRLFFKPKTYRCRRSCDQPDAGL
jgi:peptidoglycan/xylan/chitin deacetylase (PgdA/CDA1 family)